MSELRRDPVTGRWNIINTDEPLGPKNFEPETHQPGSATCPFCHGHEQLTPPEIYAIRPSAGHANTSGWQLRVVPNKFPALKIEGELGRRGLGLFDLSNGIGAHEVIIETPDHHRQMTDLTVAELSGAIAAYKHRSMDLRGDRRLKYTLLFKNFGLSAGASLEHTHSQLIALPIVPKRVQEELRGAERYFEFKERCGYCDMISQEIQEDERIVCENRSFVACAPFMSNFPFETWILPKGHDPFFEDAHKQEYMNLARVLKGILMRIDLVLTTPPYNFIIHNSPLRELEGRHYHWHLEIMPKLTQVAGFEWGSGFYINPTPPEEAAQYLREVAV